MSKIAVILSCFLLGQALALESEQEGNSLSGVNSNDGSCASPGAQWVYEFNKKKGGGKESLLDSRTGMVIFQNADWIVKASLSGQSTTSSKSSLTFYNARSLELITEINIPNEVVKLGVFPSESIFYALLVTPGKYNYDDAPLVLCIIDPLKKQLERIKLIESDYWLAIESPLGIKCDNEKLIISYDNSSIGYKGNQLTNNAFRNIEIVLNPVDKGTLGIQGINEISKSEFLVKATCDNGAISFVGIKSPTNIPYLGEGVFGKTQESKSDSLALTDKPSEEVHLVRAIESGGLSDVALDVLKSQFYKLKNSQVSQPGIFNDGTLRCTFDQKLQFVKKGKLMQIDTPRSAVFFNSKNAYLIPIKKSAIGSYPMDDDWTRSFDNPSHSTAFLVSLNGDISKITTDRSLDRINLGLGGGVYLFPEKNSLVAVSRSETPQGFLYKHQRYGFPEAEKVGAEITTITGREGGNYCEYGKSSDGWDILTAPTETYSSTIGYSVIAKNVNSNTDIHIADKLPEVAKTLELRVLKAGGFQVLFSVSGKAKLNAYSKDGTLIDRT